MKLLVGTHLNQSGAPFLRNSSALAEAGSIYSIYMEYRELASASIVAHIEISVVHVIALS